MEIYEDEGRHAQWRKFLWIRRTWCRFDWKHQKISWDAYVACREQGYTRVDVRMDSETKTVCAGSKMHSAV